MAEYIAINPDVEVTGNIIVGFFNSIRRGKELLVSIFEKHGYIPEEGKYFPQQSWLNAFKEVAEQVGDISLERIGRSVIENAEFPPLENLQQALGALDIAYHMNHRLDGKPMFNPNTGEKLDGIGNYNLVEYNAENRKAVMVCDNPYPSKFDEGIIKEIVHRFKPDDSVSYEVKIDVTKEQRSKGGDSCTYLISW